MMSDPREQAPPPIRNGAPYAELDDVNPVAVAAPVYNPAYFFSDEYPFSAAKRDRQEEERLVCTPAEIVSTENLPLMDEASRKELGLTVGEANRLNDWDLACLRKHLGATRQSVVSHEDLHRFCLMNGETPINAMDLGGIVNAPGLYDDVTLRCRLIFTNHNRLVFTQAKHSAEVSVPKTFCLASMMTSCFYARSSRRTWSSYYASINATEILQVFVQQTLLTSYDTASFNFNDVFAFLCCPKGGKLYSEKEKDMDRAVQTLGDADPEDCLSRWEKRRFMRHALVIRYVDCATNAVRDTIAMAHPDTPVSTLFEMARLIETNITMRAADWLSHKSLPTPSAGTSFETTIWVPLFQRKRYKGTLFFLFVVSLTFFAVDTTAAVFMLFSVLVAFFGAYSSRGSARAVHGAVQGLSKSVLASQVGSGGVFGLSFLLAIANSSSSGSSNSETPSYGFGT